MRSRSLGLVIMGFVIILGIFDGFLCLWAGAQTTGAPTTDQQGVLKKNSDGTAIVAQPMTKVPAGVILVKGAWSSASDSATPVPEGGSVTDHVFRDDYFGMTYAVPPDWVRKEDDPPPSATGLYVVAQFIPGETYKSASRGVILLTAQDMFFTPLPAANTLELTNYSRDHLPVQYIGEMPATDIKIAGQAFRFYSYQGLRLHWYVAATQIRCHALQFALTGDDTKLLESLMQDMNKMKLPAEASPTGGMGGGDFPVCVKDYASGENVLARVDPIFTEHRFNPVPVRIIIDKEGKVKHIHFLSAFPEQAKALSDALNQWKFKPYLVDGHPVEVETGIMFGRPNLKPTPLTSASGKSTTTGP
jgi:hypothetical protein